MDKLRLVPIGWNVYGANGKVLIVIGRQNRTLLLREDGWNIEQEEDGKYKYIKLDRESLTDLITDLSAE